MLALSVEKFSNGILQQIGIKLKFIHSDFNKHHILKILTNIHIWINDLSRKTLLLLFVCG